MWVLRLELRCACAFYFALKMFKFVFLKLLAKKTGLLEMQQYIRTYIKKNVCAKKNPAAYRYVCVGLFKIVLRWMHACFLPQRGGF